MTAVIDQLDELEIELCLRINSYGDSAWVRKFFALVSRLGDGGYWIVTGCLMLATQVEKALPFTLQILATTLVGVAIYKLLKKRLVRERPYIRNRQILLGTKPLDRYSFPSGHTMHAACLTMLYCYIEPAMLVLTLPFAVLVAMSRIILGLHYPSDVVAGAALGIALASASIQLV